MSIDRVSDDNLRNLEPLFESWNETLIWSCLQGYMGTAWADESINPKSAQIVIADFCFFAGEANEALVKNKPQAHKSDFVIMVPQNDEWAGLIDFEKGLGVAALLNGELVSGASSYTVYKDGIEIEIDTREDYRRKGLALACGAKLIVECIGRNLYPSWDAQNKDSVALAEKLGYHFDKEYIAYEVDGFGTK